MNVFLASLALTASHLALAFQQALAQLALSAQEEQVSDLMPLDRYQDPGMVRT